jgi:hypothetical protein
VDLTTSLHAVAADPPPTRIDLDALIRAEQRRGHRQRRLFGAGVASGVAVLVGAASLGWPLGSRAPIGDGEGPVCPWVSLSGDPSFPPPSASGSVMMPSMSGSAPSGDPLTGLISPPPPSVGASDSANVTASGSPAMPPSAPLPSGSGSWLGPVPSASTGDLSAAPDRSPAETCGDTMRRLEHVLTDALARIAPHARPATPIRFFNYPDGTVRAVVIFDGGGQLTVALLPLWADSYDMFKLYFVPGQGTWYDIGSPTRGLVVSDPATGPLTAEQLHDLANEPGLTLTG